VQARGRRARRNAETAGNPWRSHFFPLEHFVDRAVAALAGVVPDDIIRIIQDQMRKISEGGDGGILTFGLLVALWSSSAAMVGLIDALNRAYDIEEGRPW
jgi:membrane protein